ncbi:MULTISPECIES: integrase family protein [Pseudomonas]|uniref:gamma-mobile-trio integrase GmtZ n=1 Tax=Pseudomonas TaxID=286 RepID=UPI001E3FA2EE|nr:MULTISPECIES: integrase family protein [Pseudomonas]MCE0877429.1 integrase [Pseudomonas monteilii]MCE0929616.1 integrase [Pseudomonas monteilii]MCE0935272.1 integrase [Pseudomonas monteilii]MCE0981985.1 integrase [Pseudomonas monteilii]MCE1004931.1 integrase [Pseudomonas sp. NMI1173_11]
MTEKKPNARKASTNAAPKVVGVRRESDITLGWVERDYPQLAIWRKFAIDWLKGEVKGLDKKLKALIAFFERYLIQQKLPLDPVVFLSKNSILPDLYRVALPDSIDGIASNNWIHSFLNFVLLREFSKPADDGQPVILPSFRNPVPRLSRAGMPKNYESVYSPLPYGYIVRLRQILAAGPHFRDWQWAQDALGTATGHRGFSAPDWFEVEEEQIDRNDPDCVWRVRKFNRNYRGGSVLEMWSPVRWVALLAKLILPLRGHQVRLLDSGEADTWRYEKSAWTLNTNRLSEGSKRRPLRQGVFRRSDTFVEGAELSTQLYINTNKTSDIAKSGPEKGYVLPWPAGGAEHQDILYWFEKLRDWQEKYNPITRRTNWAELDARHIVVKSEVQLAGYPGACFLFRLPESRDGKRNLPLTRDSLDMPWYRLLETLELQLVNKGEKHSNGTQIRFIPAQELRTQRVPGTYTVTLFPLHSLRVSLITALALEGLVPFPILQKLVGHSRLLMTLYYTKPGATHIRDVLSTAVERLEKNKEVSIQNFLLDTEYDELLEKAICNNESSLAAAIAPHPAERNPVGWMPMHHGVCLVGGNTSEIEENSSVGGCYNGGPQIGPPSLKKYSQVPGGSRNCVRCRWFVTEPHHMPALVAHFNTLAYHFDEARNACIAHENTLQDLKKQKADAEEENQPFARIDAYRQAERVWEKSIKRFSDLAEDLVACWRLIERCKSALHAPLGDGTQLIVSGMVGDVNIAFEETESELLQLAGVCESVELYPDLEPGKAVFRRSQLLDAVLYREDLSPLFMLLSEQEQLLAGNAFMRHLALKMNPENPALGQRQVIHLIDAGVNLSHHFDIDLATLLPPTNYPQTAYAKHRILPGDET